MKNSQVNDKSQGKVDKTFFTKLCLRFLRNEKPQISASWGLMILYVPFMFSILEQLFFFFVHHQKILIKRTEEESLVSLIWRYVTNSYISSFAMKF